MPYKVDQDPDAVAVDPYGPESPDFIVGDDFVQRGARCWRFARSGSRVRWPQYRKHEKSGGLGCFTPDKFPVFNSFRENVYVIADCNHGYKMLGVGKLVAQEARQRERLLEPFRFSRFEKGELHPTSNSPFPWS